MTTAQHEVWHTDGHDVRDENGLRVAYFASADDATLAGAAPDMLAALKLGRDALAAWMEIADEEDDRDSDMEALEAMEAAIAAATPSDGEE